MTTTQARKVNDMLTEIRLISMDLPKGKSHKVQNRCSKISMIVKKSKNNQETQTEKDMTGYSANKAILAALMEGRHLSQMDCREFMIEDMRTCVCHLKKQFEGTHELKKKWIVSPVRGSRIREYWLEAR